jgi:hypothetical protein
MVTTSITKRSRFCFGLGEEEQSKVQVTTIFSLNSGVVSVTMRRAGHALGIVGYAESRRQFPY